LRIALHVPEKWLKHIETHTAQCAKTSEANNGERDVCKDGLPRDSHKPLMAGYEL
jgi:hypothetical protein